MHSVVNIGSSSVSIDIHSGTHVLTTASSWSCPRPTFSVAYPPPPLPRQSPSLPQMDSNLNITVSLTDYNCFNSEGPNMCDGGIKEASPHKRANTIYFVVTCVVLGSLALILVGVIIVTTLKPKNNGNDDDDEGAPLTQGDSYAPHGGRSVN